MLSEAEITAMFSMDNAGNLVGPVIGGFVAAWWGIRAPFLVCTARWRFWPLFQASKSSRACHRHSVAQRRSGWRRSRQGVPGGWSQFLQFKILILFVSYLFVSLTRGTQQGGTLNVYAVYQYGIDTATVGAMAAVVAAVGIPVTMTAGHIMDRFGRKATIVPGFAALSIAMVIMAMVAYTDVPFLIFVAALIGVSLSQSYTGGSMQTLATDVAPANARGKFFGLWNLLGQSGTFISPARSGSSRISSARPPPSHSWHSAV